MISTGHSCCKRGLPVLISPTLEQRKALLGNISLRDRGNGRRSASGRGRDPGPLKSGRTWRLSPFAFLFSGKGYSALYHSLGLNKIFGGRRLAKLHAMGKSGQYFPAGAWRDLLGKGGESDSERELSMLVDGGFLVPEGENPLLPLTARQGQCRLRKPHIGLLYLLITNDCNLRCGYCSIESLQRKPSSFRYHLMQPETARRGIDLFFDLLEPGVKEPRVFYYGGEPLLNTGVFLDSASYIRERERGGAAQCRKTDISMVCNGTLVTEQNAAAMKELSISASVSLDGLKHHHDGMRLRRDGAGSWEDSIRGYFLIRKHTGRCGISCTLGPHNIGAIEELAEFFATKLECRGLGFNIMKGLPAGNDLEVPVNDVTMQIIRAYEVFRRYGIYEDRIMRKISSFVLEEPWIHDCGGYGGQIALCADGVMGPCHVAADDHRFCWGSLDDPGIRESILNGGLTLDFCRRSPLTMKECFDCVGLGICGGGCAEEAFIKHGDIFALDGSFCVHCKTLLRWMFDDMASKLKASGVIAR